MFNYLLQSTNMTLVKKEIKIYLYSQEMSYVIIIIKTQLTTCMCAPFSKQRCNW